MSPTPRETPCCCHEHHSFAWREFLIGLVIAACLTGMLAVFDFDELLSPASLTPQTSLLIFALLGFLESLSHCAAVVGGLILSLARHWTNRRARVLGLCGFTLGRLMMFGVGGFLLGLLGQVAKFNLTVNYLFLRLIALLVLGTGLHQLGLLKFLPLPHWPLRLPGGQAKPKLDFIFPWLIGAVTFFLPCGITYALELLAVSATSPWQASLICLSFVLGGLPVLVLVGLSGSLHHTQDKYLSTILNYTLGWLLVLLGLLGLVDIHA